MNQKITFLKLKRNFIDNLQPDRYRLIVIQADTDDIGIAV